MWVLSFLTLDNDHYSQHLPQCSLTDILQDLTTECILKMSKHSRGCHRLTTCYRHGWQVKQYKTLVCRVFILHSSLDDDFGRNSSFVSNLKTQALQQGGDLQCMTCHVRTQSTQKQCENVLSYNSQGSPRILFLNHENSMLPQHCGLHRKDECSL